MNSFSLQQAKPASQQQAKPASQQQAKPASRPFILLPSRSFCAAQPAEKSKTIRHKKNHLNFFFN